MWDRGSVSARAWFVRVLNRVKTLIPIQTIYHYDALFYTQSRRLFIFLLRFGKTAPLNNPVSILATSVLESDGYNIIFHVLCHRLSIV